MCSHLHAPSLAATRGQTIPPPPRTPQTWADIADGLAIELHTKAERKRVQRLAAESAQAVLIADEALARMTLALRFCPGIGFHARSLIAERVRTAMVAHHAALLRVTEIEALAARMGVQG